MSLTKINITITFLASFCYFICNNLVFNNGITKNTKLVGIISIIIFYLSFLFLFYNIIKETYDEISQNNDSLLWSLISLCITVSIYTLFFFFIPSSLANGGIITKGYGEKTWNPFKDDMFQSSGKFSDKIKFGALVLPLTLMNYLFLWVPKVCKGNCNEFLKYLNPLDETSIGKLSGIDTNEFYYNRGILMNVFYLTILLLFIPYILTSLTQQSLIFYFLVFCSICYIIYFLILRKRNKSASFFHIFTNGPCGPFDPKKITSSMNETLNKTIKGTIFPLMKPLENKNSLTK